MQSLVTCLVLEKTVSGSSVSRDNYNSEYHKLCPVSFMYKSKNQIINSFFLIYFKRIIREIFSHFSDKNKMKLLDEFVLFWF